MANAMMVSPKWRLEKPLRNNDDVARSQRDVAFDIAVLDQAVDLQRIGFLGIVDGSHQRCPVSGCEPRQTAHFYHRVKKCHVGEIGYGFRLSSLADDTNLPIKRPNN